MKYLVIGLFVFISSCCPTVIPSIADTNEINNCESLADEIQKENEQFEWEQAENEEIVSIIESSDVSKWVVGISKQIILGWSYNIDFHLKASHSIFFRVSIFHDGTIYLDGAERKLLRYHKNRLTKFFVKVRNAHSKADKPKWSLLAKRNLA